MDPLYSAKQQSAALLSRASRHQIDAALKSPIIILSAPRSGSTLLFEYLTRLQGTSWIGGKSHQVFRHFPQLRVESAAMNSASLNERHADPKCRQLFRDNMAYLLRDHQGQSFIENPELFLNRTTQFIEKTPRNALNIPFLNKVFPDARFIFLHRKPQSNIASIIEAWTLGLQTGRFMTFPKLPEWDRQGWCFLLPPGWRDLIGGSLAEIASFQWRLSNQTIVDNLRQLPRERYSIVSYEEALTTPQATLNKLIDFIGIKNSISHKNFASELSTTAITKPHHRKWEKHQSDIEPLLTTLSTTLSSIELLTTFKKSTN